MRHGLLIFIFGIFAGLLLAGLIANAAPLTGDRTASAQAHSAAVVADEEHGAIRFMIDGREVAWFTGGGLHVRDDIEFGGVIADVGAEGFDQGRRGE